MNGRLLDRSAEPALDKATLIDLNRKAFERFQGIDARYQREHATLIALGEERMNALMAVLGLGQAVEAHLTEGVDASPFTTAELDTVLDGERPRGVLTKLYRMADAAERTPRQY